MSDSETHARGLSLAYQSRPHREYYESIIGGSNVLKKQPGHVGLPSSLCQQIHFSLDEYRHWMWAIGEPPRFHRKLWEWFYVVQTLFERGMLAEGRKGLAFAVGLEKLPALFAAHGCEILATDQALESAQQQGWTGTGEHAGELAQLANAAICPDDAFYKRVKFLPLDMNHIPEDLDGTFDFCWSSCSFEHLGSLNHGLRFVENAMRTLKPGGVAVHTTEFNLTSNDKTLELDVLSIYRRQDIERLIDTLESAGHHVAPIDWTQGAGFVENIVDLPPYQSPGHLRLRLAEYDCTSIGLIVTKGMK